MLFVRPARLTSERILMRPMRREIESCAREYELCINVVAQDFTFDGYRSKIQATKIHYINNIGSVKNRLKKFILIITPASQSKNIFYIRLDLDF